MGQKCGWICIVLLVAIYGAVGSRECTEERAAECKEKLFDILFGDSEDACGELYGVSECLRNVADACLGEEELADVKESLKEFEEYLEKECTDTSEGDEEEIRNCLEENQDYLMKCIFDEEKGQIGALQGIESPPLGMSPGFAKCYVYRQMKRCAVSRAEEKCGEAAGELFANDMPDTPPSLQESCDSQDDQRKRRTLRMKRGLLNMKKRALLEYRQKRGSRIIRLKKRALEFTK